MVFVMSSSSSIEKNLIFPMEGGKKAKHKNYSPSSQ
jgi:hypothetical protein